MVSSTPRPHFTPGKDPVPILQEAGWAPGPIWTGGKSRPHRDSIPDRPARSQSLYRLSYRAHKTLFYSSKFPWTRARISSKCIDNLGTRPEKSFASPGLASLSASPRLQSMALLNVNISSHFLRSFSLQWQ